MIETIMLAGTEGARKIMREYESATLAYGGRPHWGQINFLSAASPSELYPRYNQWLKVRDEMSPQGMFANSFTERVGISDSQAGTNGASEAEADRSLSARKR